MIISDSSLEYTVKLGGGLLISYFAYKFLFRQLHNPFPDQFLARYDYVIVGGGSAGCILANRLKILMSRFCYWKLVENMITS